MKALFFSCLVLLTLYSCSFHSGNISSSALPNCQYQGMVSAKTSSSHFLGIGGLVAGALVKDAKNKLLVENPPKSGVILTNYSLDVKRSFYFIVSTTVFTVSAEKYNCPVQTIATNAPFLSAPSSDSIVKTKIATLEVQSIQPQEITQIPTEVKASDKSKTAPNTIAKTVSASRPQLFDNGDSVFFINNEIINKAIVISNVRKICKISYLENSKESTKNVLIDDLYQTNKIDLNKQKYGYQIGDPAKIEVFVSQTNSNSTREGKIIGIGKNGIIMEYLKQDGTLRQLQVPFDKIL